MSRVAVRRGASPEAIRHHYDVSDDFYALWLDRSLTYTCALWDDAADPAETLEQAQQRKLDHLITAAKAAGRRRVLDVGCGWGSLLRRLTEGSGVERAVGLTLSESQAKWVRGQQLPGTEVRLESWQDHTPEEGYDAVISIGAFEHFAATGLRRAERVAAYREFFERCSGWLPRGGRLALQTNIKGNNVRLDRRAVSDLLFIMERVFPESEIPALSEVVEAAERRFDVVALRNDPEHYSRTVQEWHSRLITHREAAESMVGKRTYASYERYLRTSAEHFQKRHLGLARIVLEKVR
ncbi:class I SAM-dependent methyltransferase [Streptomyces sp. JJ66]|uniref:SAM-dependent methyltransferase n=1 Tax=Streptomyces sp. JJ66 TaxID=2803843 RepID=UPI001C58B4DA|nr:cyclopropane-fatty-acyl-phospholipid synthase family protein [Streptomyces sp. JJ66]MBW1602241.1 class I SAM-dependent methyltransferase [Streptomyces sp. JJ66]